MRISMFVLFALFLLCVCLCLFFALVLLFLLCYFLLIYLTFTHIISSMFVLFALFLLCVCAQERDTVFVSGRRRWAERDDQGQFSDIVDPGRSSAIDQVFICDSLFFSSLSLLGIPVLFFSLFCFDLWSCLWFICFVFVLLSIAFAIWLPSRVFLFLILRVLWLDFCLFFIAFTFVCPFWFLFFSASDSFARLWPRRLGASVGSSLEQGAHHQGLPQILGTARPRPQRPEKNRRRECPLLLQQGPQIRQQLFQLNCWMMPINSTLQWNRKATVLCSVVSAQFCNTNF